MCILECGYFLIKAAETPIVVKYMDFVVFGNEVSYELVESLLGTVRVVKVPLVDVC